MLHRYGKKILQGVFADILPPNIGKRAVHLSVGRAPSIEQLRRLSAYHVPLQCTPSAWLGPMMTLERLAPSSSTNIASASPVSVCSSQTFAISGVSYSQFVEICRIGLTVTVIFLHATVKRAANSDCL